MVAIVRLEGYEKLVYMRHFSEKATVRRTGGNRNPNSLSGAKGKSYVYQICPTRCLIA
jgi:hypothetical protein